MAGALALACSAPQAPEPVAEQARPRATLQVRIGADGVRVGDEVVAAIVSDDAGGLHLARVASDGELVPGLRDALQARPPARVDIAVEDGVEFGVVRAVMFTIGHTGHDPHLVGLERAQRPR